MSRPVNKIKFKRLDGKTCGRDLRLLIDGVDLFDHLEKSSEGCPTPGTWSDKHSATFYPKGLKKSMRVSGDIPLIGSIAAPCLPEDVSLREFTVVHGEGYIMIKAFPPGAGYLYEMERELEFRFHKPQYVVEVEKLLTHVE